MGHARASTPGAEDMSMPDIHLSKKKRLIVFFNITNGGSTRIYFVHIYTYVHVPTHTHTHTLGAGPSSFPDRSAQ